VDEKPNTTLDRLKDRLKNIPLIAWLVLAGLGVIFAAQVLAGFEAIGSSIASLVGLSTSTGDCQYVLFPSFEFVSSQIVQRGYAVVKVADATIEIGKEQVAAGFVVVLKGFEHHSFQISVTLGFGEPFPPGSAPIRIVARSYDGNIDLAAGRYFLVSEDKLHGRDIGVGFSAVVHPHLAVEPASEKDKNNFLKPHHLSLSSCKTSQPGISKQQS
jgi:hypothetical protein